jgi:hypothetical protein
MVDLRELHPDPQPGALTATGGLASRAPATALKPRSRSMVKPCSWPVLAGRAGADDALVRRRRCNATTLILVNEIGAALCPQHPGAIPPSAEEPTQTPVGAPSPMST